MESCIYIYTNIKVCLSIILHGYIQCINITIQFWYMYVHIEIMIMMMLITVVSP